MRKLGALEACGHHVAEHGRRGRVHPFRKYGEVGIGLVYVKPLAKNAVFEVGKFPAGQHAPGMHGKSALGFYCAPVGSDGGNDDFVAGFKVFDKSTDLDNFTNALMSQNHIGTFTNRAFPYCVDI